MNAAISCGNRIMLKTTATAAHNKTLPSRLPRTAHCLARCCCQNPSAIKAIETPKSQGRSVVKKALAAPAPKAAAKPRGRQQLIVARELRIAPSDAEMPVPGFTAMLLAGPLTPLDEPSPLVGDRSVRTQGISGSSERNSLPSLILRRHPV